VGKVSVSKRSNHLHAGDAVEELVVKLFVIVAEAGHEAHAGDDDALLRVGLTRHGGDDDGCFGFGKGWEETSANEEPSANA
jgi:hypothetical protein